MLFLNYLWSLWLIHNLLEHCIIQSPQWVRKHLHLTCRKISRCMLGVQLLSRISTDIYATRLISEVRVLIVSGYTYLRT